MLIRMKIFYYNLSVLSDNIKSSYGNILIITRLNSFQSHDMLAGTNVEVATNFGYYFKDAIDTTQTVIYEKIGTDNRNPY